MKTVVLPLVLAVLIAGGCASSPAVSEPPPATATVDAKAASAANALASAIATCAKVASCTDSTDDRAFRDPGSCVDAWMTRGGPDDVDPLRACLEGTKTCDAVRACLRGGGDAKAATFCAAQKGVVTACDGDRLVRCGDSERALGSVVDCKALGGACRERKTSGGLLVRGCFSAQMCPEGAPESRCEDGSTVLGCHDGVVDRVRCNPGSRCAMTMGDDGEPRARCLTSSRCGLPGTQRCDGSIRVACGSAGDAETTSCASYGLGCASAGLRAACAPDGTAHCDPDAPPRCEDGGRILSFCAAGLTRRVACSALGLGACQPGAHGAAAACSSP